MKCNDMLSMIAPHRYRLSHGLSVSRDSFSDSELRAFAISIVTSTERDTVVALLENSLTNISQPISGNCVEQAWKLVYQVISRCPFDTRHTKYAQAVRT